MVNIYNCNRCGEQMTYQDPKTILVDVGGDDESIVHDVHICRRCRSQVIDYINSDVGVARQKRNPRTGKFAK